ncbi:MAG: metallophosphoesterase [Terricaulis sp.]
MSGKFLLAQISDTHVRADDGGAAAAQLQRAMAQAKDNGAQLILLTGDLVNDEKPEEYAALAQAIAQPPAPLFLMPGNHDNRGHLRAAFAATHKYLPQQGPLSFVLDDFPVRIVALDATAPGEVHAVFGKEQERWLRKTLSKQRKKPTIVSLHHPPFLTHDRLFDTIGLQRADKFARVIAGHKQVSRIICGHHHRVAVGQVAHATTVVAPSTSWIYGLAVQENQPIAPRTSERPGWMLHAWTPSGGFASHFMEL